MPLIYMNYPEGAFAADSLSALAEKLTTIGMEAEKEPDTPSMRSANWLFAHEYTPDKVFVGGKPDGSRVITLEISLFRGGVDDLAKEEMISRVTEVVRQHLGLTITDRAPVYVLIHEILPSNWGVFGGRITLSDLRNPPDANLFIT